MKDWKCWSIAVVLLLVVTAIAIFIFFAAALSTTPDSTMGLPAFLLAFLKEVFDFLSSFVWPAVVLILAFSFRDQISPLWARLASLNVGGVKLTFDKELEKIEQEVVEEANERGAPFLLQRPAADDRFLRLLDIAPSAAIVNKWVDVELALRALAVQRNVPLRENEAPMHVIKALRQYNVIGERPEKILHQLRNLRNLAAHPNHPSFREISKEEALRFGAMADDILDLLSRK